MKREGETEERNLKYRVSGLGSGKKEKRVLVFS